MRFKIKKVRYTIFKRTFKQLLNQILIQNARIAIDNTIGNMYLSRCD